ncbi:MAG: LysM peptidoglycan-binding domain-containing protein [Spirochaetaceae bacterium]|jgi:nucleoid-associated protein YgaU|nr:LysM peptidoglycan-binding domain-containing protein [Spirochaetaceae bacterium]
MKKRAWWLLPGMVLAAIQVFAQAVDAGGAVSHRVLNNDYYMQSLRLSGLARNSYEAGDYDASTAYAEEAARYARLSDGYVSERAVSAAQSRVVWASSDAVRAVSRYPEAFHRAEGALAAAEANHGQEQYIDAIAAANRVFEALSSVTAIAGAAPSRPSGTFPARYTVRSWATFRDCLWNIAGRSWAYGDPAQWRLIYNANKSRFPNPDDPDLIEPGMVLEIPSVRGETRSGLWSSDTSYPAMR